MEMRVAVRACGACMKGGGHFREKRTSRRSGLRTRLKPPACLAHLHFGALREDHKFSGAGGLASGRMDIGFACDSLQCGGGGMGEVSWYLDSSGSVA